MLTILMYHSIDGLGLTTSVRPDRFAAQMAFLAKHQYKMLSIGEAVELLNSDRPLPPRCAVLTFDDGYRSVYTVAFEELQRYSFPATVYVTSGYCGKLSNWPSHRPEHSTRKMLSATELRELHGHGMAIGAHTVNHHHLAGLPPEQARHEIEASQDQLEQMVGERVRHFAYPFGELNEDLRSLVANRFDSACGVEFRFATRGDDIYNLPRIDSYFLDDLMRLGGATSWSARTYVRIRHGLRLARSKLTPVDGYGH